MNREQAIEAILSNRQYAGKDRAWAEFELERAIANTDGEENPEFLRQILKEVFKA